MAMGQATEASQTRMPSLSLTATVASRQLTVDTAELLWATVEGTGAIKSEHRSERN